ASAPHGFWPHRYCDRAPGARRAPSDYRQGRFPDVVRRALMSRDLPASKRLGGFFMAVRPTKNGKKRRIVVYDTTLRDGAQGSFVTFSITPKHLIARALHRLGLDHIEAGFPGSYPY